MKSAASELHMISPEAYAEIASQFKRKVTHQHRIHLQALSEHQDSSFQAKMNQVIDIVFSASGIAQKPIEALKLMDTALQIIPNNAHALFMQGHLYHTNNEFEKCKACFLKAMALDKKGNAVVPEFQISILTKLAECMKRENIVESLALTTEKYALEIPNIMSQMNSINAFLARLPAMNPAIEQLKSYRFYAMRAEQHHETIRGKEAIAEDKIKEHYQAMIDNSSIAIWVLINGIDKSENNNVALATLYTSRRNIYLILNKLDQSYEDHCCLLSLMPDTMLESEKDIFIQYTNTIREKYEKNNAVDAAKELLKFGMRLQTEILVQKEEKLSVDNKELFFDFFKEGEKNISYNDSLMAEHFFTSAINNSANVPEENLAAAYLYRVKIYRAKKRIDKASDDLLKITTLKADEKTLQQTYELLAFLSREDANKDKHNYYLAKTREFNEKLFKSYHREKLPKHIGAKTEEILELLLQCHTALVEKDRDPVKALDLANAVVNLTKEEDNTSLSLRAYAHYLNKNLKEAERDCLIVIQRMEKSSEDGFTNPNMFYYEAYFYLALIYFSQNKKEILVRRMFQKGIQNLKSDSGLILAIGFQEITDIYIANEKKGLNINSKRLEQLKSNDSFLVRALQNIRDLNWKDASIILDHLLTIEPYNSSTFIMRGFAAFNRHHFEEAIDNYNMALWLISTHLDECVTTETLLDLFAKRRLVYAEMENLDESLHNHRLMLKHSRTNQHDFLNLKFAEFLCELGEKTKSNQLLQASRCFLFATEIAIKQPSIAVMCHNFTISLTKLGDQACAKQKYKKALDYYTMACELEPTNNAILNKYNELVITNNVQNFSAAINAVSYKAKPKEVIEPVVIKPKKELTQAEVDQKAQLIKAKAKERELRKKAARLERNKDKPNHNSPKPMVVSADLMTEFKEEILVASTVEKASIPEVCDNQPNNIEINIKKIGKEKAIKTVEEKASVSSTALLSKEMHDKPIINDSKFPFNSKDEELKDSDKEHPEYLKNFLLFLGQKKAFVYGGYITDTSLGLEPNDIDIGFCMERMEGLKILEREDNPLRTLYHPFTIFTDIDQSGNVITVARFNPLPAGKISTFDKSMLGKKCYPIEVIFKDVVDPKKMCDSTVDSFFMLFNEQKDKFQVCAGHEKSWYDRNARIHRACLLAKTSYKIDIIRALRAVRKVTRRKFKIADDNDKAIRDNAAKLLTCSKIRVHKEIIKLFLTGRGFESLPSPFTLNKVQLFLKPNKEKLLLKFLIGTVLPELSDAKDYDHEWLTHEMLRIDQCVKEGLRVNLDDFYIAVMVCKEGNKQNGNAWAGAVDWNNVKERNPFFQDHFKARMDFLKRVDAVVSRRNVYYERKSSLSEQAMSVGVAFRS